MMYKVKQYYWLLFGAIIPIKLINIFISIPIYNEKEYGKQKKS